MVEIDFRTAPERYRHWRLHFEGDTASLVLDVDEEAGLFEGYQLKLNSYDAGVDIELHDAVQRLRFEHPEVKVVVLRSGKEKVFCAGANIRMLAGAAHAHKVNFCKLTNETRLAIEDASERSGQRYLAAVNGSCAGGGYELALAADRVLLLDDGSSTVSLPEAPLLAVLPGTGGLTRLTDKRKVRRDLADVFCSTEEGVRGQRAVDWRLVDEVAPSSSFEEVVKARARALAETSDRPGIGPGITFSFLERQTSETGLAYSSLRVDIDRAGATATLTLLGPESAPPESAERLVEAGDRTWALRLARELDDALLHLRFNELEIGVLVFRTEGELERVAAHDAFLRANREHWLAREIRLFWTRVLKRIDMTSRSLACLVEPGSCYAGFLAELLFACDQSFMAEGDFADVEAPEASLRLSEASFGEHPMGNGLSRLETRFLGEPESIARAREAAGRDLPAGDAAELGLVTHALDEIDWEDELRLFLEQRASFSPDAMTGMEQNLRFGGPETMETKIFGRLTAWQNWIFQRPNAVGPEGALRRYGSGQRPELDPRRV